MLHGSAIRIAALVAAGVLVLCPYQTFAKDVFLTIGGGYGCTSNQMSLERNVIFQQAVLAEKRPDGPKHIVLFADGEDTAPDVQWRDPEFCNTCPAARQLMAELVGDASSMDLRYRDNEVPNVNGPSDSDGLKRQLRALAGELKAGDRLIIYATGHGGPAESDYYGDDYDYEYDEDSQTWKATSTGSDGDDIQNDYNTSLYFYDGDSITVSDLAGWLDRVPREVEVVLVMVQCYAGGFAHTIFHQADADLGLSPHARCGFFAQVHDRGAAGCTPNATESEYQEYSSYFWGALAGRSRVGEELESADYDEDGKVSFAEAHAYAVIVSDTIDIPVRTSDAMLRHYSSLAKKTSEDENNADGNPLGKLFGLLATQPAADEGQSLLKLEGSIVNIAKLARPDQRAIIEQLSTQLELGDNPTIESTKLALRKVAADGQLARVKQGTAAERFSKARRRVRQELIETWPELESDYAPLAMELASERADEFVAKVKGLASYEAMCRAKESREELEAKSQELTHREARFQRLLHTCKSVVLAANLPKVMPQEIVDRYEKLVAIEEGAL